MVSAGRNSNGSSPESVVVRGGFRAAWWPREPGERGEMERGSGRLSERGYHAKSMLQLSEFTRGLIDRERQRGLGKNRSWVEKMTTWLWGPLAAREKERKRGPPVSRSSGVCPGAKRFLSGEREWAGSGPCGLCRLGWSRFYFFLPIAFPFFYFQFLF